METLHKYKNQGEVIEVLYNLAEAAVGQNDLTTALTEIDKAYVAEVVRESEQNKGMLAVLMTLFCHKVFDPQ